MTGPEAWGPSVWAVEEDGVHQRRALRDAPDFEGFDGCF